MKSAMRLKALIRNLAKEKNLQTEIVLRNYMLERFLERVSLSEHRHQLILKGGLLIANLIGIEARSTMDLDATVKGVMLTEEELTKMLNNILAVPVDDGVQMILMGFENIIDEADYPGIRVSIESILERTRQALKVDITTGDAITPKEVEYSYKLLIENRNIAIMAYNLETVLAEKLETILTLSIASTRMRDYYDVYALMALKNESVDKDIFASAFQQTAKKRGSFSLLANKGPENIEAIKNSGTLPALWKRYQAKNAYASDVKWEDVLSSVEQLYQDT